MIGLHKSLGRDKDGTVYKDTHNHFNLLTSHYGDVEWTLCLVSRRVAEDVPDGDPPHQEKMAWRVVLRHQGHISWQIFGKRFFPLDSHAVHSQFDGWRQGLGAVLDRRGCCILFEKIITRQNDNWVENLYLLGNPKFQYCIAWQREVGWQ